MSATHGKVLLDAHVHFHAGFSEPVFFEAAVRNFARVDGGGVAVCGLMLTESHGVDAFGRWEKSARRDVRDDGGGGVRGGSGGRIGSAAGDGAGWTFRVTAERNSLWAVGGGGGAEPGHRVLVIAGRQLVTEERFEVLALGCRRELPDDLPLRQARDAVIAAGGIPVVPWGFGKWWFARGRLLAELIAADCPGTWFLGDNAGRPRLSLRPKLFEVAARRGVWVLPGSDPLPLGGQDKKAGRCGFVLPRMGEAAAPAGALAERPAGVAAAPATVLGERPAAAVLDALRGCSRQPETFGRLESLVVFARQQVAMQMRGSP
jgi:hypothetical protein